MTTVLAIDPGNTESAYVIVEAATHQPVHFGKIDNNHLRDLIWTAAPGQIIGDINALEMIASYGMPVGAEIFNTCVWIGRFFTAIECATGQEPDLVFRKPVKIHHCGTTQAKDPNIIQALVDRFAPGQPNKGKGTKSDPGWFHGFAADVWQAYALAVYVIDKLPADSVVAPTALVSAGATTAQGSLL